MFVIKISDKLLSNTNKK